MPNTNCLAGIRCPKCGSEETFHIQATVIVEAEDDGTGSYEDVDWTGEYIRCDHCQRQGRLIDFDVDWPSSLAGQIHSYIEWTVDEERVRLLEQVENMALAEAMRRVGLINAEGLKRQLEFLGETKSYEDIETELGI